MRSMRLDDPLGHLVPPGSLRPSDLLADLVEVMERHRFLAGIGVPSVPTRYAVRMNPADRAWLDPTTEDELARALTAHAERMGALVVGAIEVELRSDPGAALGRPSYWAGFAEDDLLVLADPSAATDVFAGRS